MIRTDDHGSPHCHAVGSGCKAKIYLSDFEVVQLVGFSKKDIKQIVELVKDHRQQLLDKWEEYHGKD